MFEGQRVFAGLDFHHDRSGDFPHTHGVRKLEFDSLVRAIGADHKVLLPAPSHHFGGESILAGFGSVEGVLEGLRVANS